jgi:MFS family permease
MHLIKGRRVIFTRENAVFSVLALFTVLSLFYRVSTAVIAPTLIADLSLNAETIGLLGGAFFYSFALMQIPMGPLLDRIGPRVVISCFAFIGALGAFIFALAQSYAVALTARVLMGIGMSPVLMGSFKVFTLAFPPNTFSTLAGLVVSAGTIGNMLASSPLAYAAAHIGWRTVFFITGVATLALGILNFFILRNLSGITNHTATPSTERAVSFVQSAKLILGSLSFWQIGTAAFFRYGTFVSLQGLWLGLYLIEARHFLPIDAGNILIMLAVGNLVGGPIAGRIRDLSAHGTKAVTLAGLTLYCVSLFPLYGVWLIKSKVAFMLICFFIGFFHAFGTLLYAHAKELFPLSIAATAMAWANFFIMLGGAVLTSALGKLIELFPRSGNAYPPEAYQLSFLICFVSMAVSLVFYGFSKNLRPSKVISPFAMATAKRHIIENPD